MQGAEQTKEALKSGKEMLGGLFGKAAEAKAKVLLDRWKPDLKSQSVARSQKT